MTLITLDYLQKLKQKDEKITALTAYDASFAELLSNQGIEILLVGDTLGMVINGHSTTLPVTIKDIVYHVGCVAKGNQQSLLLADLPFMTYANSQTALNNAAKLMRAGACAVKMEGGRWLAETVTLMTQRGIPVCGHLGLTPQSVHQLSGYRVQGKTSDQAQHILEDALILEEAGIRLLILECVPYDLASRITQRLSIPVIGIGAGAACDGQILVTYDILGITQGKHFKFVKNFLQAHFEQRPSNQDNFTLQGVIRCYCNAVKQGLFPDKQHSF